MLILPGRCPCRLGFSRYAGGLRGSQSCRAVESSHPSTCSGPGEFALGYSSLVGSCLPSSLGVGNRKISIGTHLDFCGAFTQTPFPSTHSTIPSTVSPFRNVTLTGSPAFGRDILGPEGSRVEKPLLESEYQSNVSILPSPGLPRVFPPHPTLSAALSSSLTLHGSS